MYLIKPIAIFAFIALSITTFGQNSTTEPLMFGKEVEPPKKKSAPEKKGAKAYGGFYGMVDLKQGKLGGGLNIGFSPVPAWGIGAVVDAITIEGVKSGNKAGISTMGEIRVFPQVPNIWPSLAFQYGLFNYSEDFYISVPRAVSQGSVDGKAQIGGAVNFRFGKSANKAGLSLGYSFRSVKFSTDIKTSVINSNGSTTKSTSYEEYTGEYHLLTLGIRF